MFPLKNPSPPTNRVQAPHAGSVLSAAGLLLALSITPTFGQAPRPGLTEENIVYGNAGGEQLTLDYYRAAGPGPHPLAIIIHGGGFVAGNSKNVSEAYCADFLAPAGYAVFSINYRLAPETSLSRHGGRRVTAVRFLRSHAGKWDADPQRMALVGGSAGGYLSNMAGLRGVGTDAQVQAVVTLYRAQRFFRAARQRSSPSPVGSADQSERARKRALREASPLTYVTAKSPPFLLIHGDKDQSVAFEQSTRLQEALRKVGVPCDLIRIATAPMPQAAGTPCRVSPTGSVKCCSG